MLNVELRITEALFGDTTSSPNEERFLYFEYQKDGEENTSARIVTVLEITKDLIVASEFGTNNIKKFKINNMSDVQVFYKFTDKEVSSE